jgi:nitrate reductase (NAD(P)H)
MQIGESIAVKGPIGHVMYRGDGEYTVNKTTYHAKKLVMLAGGTGITPMWQVILATSCATSC